MLTTGSGESKSHTAMPPRPSQFGALLPSLACQPLLPCKCFIHINESNQDSNQIRENLPLILHVHGIVCICFIVCNVAPS